MIYFMDRLREGRGVHGTIKHGGSSSSYSFVHVITPGESWRTELQWRRTAITTQVQLAALSGLLGIVYGEQECFGVLQGVGDSVPTEQRRC